MYEHQSQVIGFGFTSDLMTEWNEFLKSQSLGIVIQNYDKYDLLFTLKRKSE